MAQNDRKRQKRLERRAAKRKERGRELIAEKSGGLAEHLQRASAWPILDSLVTDSIRSEGMGQVLVSRQLSHGKVAVAVFLVDRYCLGVKNAFGRIMDVGAYRQLLKSVTRGDEPITLTPEEARSLVERAVAYAADLGFSPHPDYYRGKPIFGDVDASRTICTFEFGRDGKPFYIQGPHDTPAFSRRVYATLTERCGKGGFDFILVAGEQSLDLLTDATPLGLESSEMDSL